MITAMEINPEKIFTKDFFSLLPFDIALLDKNYNVVWANELYKENFGETNGKTCYTICKQNKFPCQHCRVPEAFETGETVVSYESIVDVYGKQLSLAVYFIPIKGENGEIKYVFGSANSSKRYEPMAKRVQHTFRKCAQLYHCDRP